MGRKEFGEQRPYFRLRCCYRIFDVNWKKIKSNSFIHVFLKVHYENIPKHHCYLEKPCYLENCVLIKLYKWRSACGWLLMFCCAVILLAFHMICGQSQIDDYLNYSVQPKPLFWFKSNTDTETKISWYFWANTVTDTETRFQGENPVTNFFHHQRAPKTKFVAKY